MIGLCVFTDGRFDHLAQTLRSFDAHCSGKITKRLIFNDEPDRRFVRDLDAVFADRYEIHHAPERRGFAGTIAYAWSHRPDTGWLFHLEDDFTFTRDVDLDAMALVLGTQPTLAQMALRRQPVSPPERIAGGVVEQWPGEYLDRHVDLMWDLTPMVHDSPPEQALVQRFDWLEHRLFFTTNPSLYRASLTSTGWPVVDRSEAAFTGRLFEDPAVRCGYWGARGSGEWVHHIGQERRGMGY